MGPGRSLTANTCTDTLTGCRQTVVVLALEVMSSETGHVAYGIGVVPENSIVRVLHAGCACSLSLCIMHAATPSLCDFAGLFHSGKPTLS